MRSSYLITLFGLTLFSLGVRPKICISPGGDFAHSSAIFEVRYDNYGILIPRMTKAQRDAISNPAHSLLIYQTDVDPGYYYNAGDEASPNWVKIGLSSHTHANLTFDSNGTGAASGSSYNGSNALTISYNTIGAVGGSGAATRVAFWDDLNTLSSDAALYWDNTNKRLGI